MTRRTLKRTLEDMIDELVEYDLNLDPTGRFIENEEAIYNVNGIAMVDLDGIASIPSNVSVEAGEFAVTGDKTSHSKVIRNQKRREKHKANKAKGKRNGNPSGTTMQPGTENDV